MLDYFEKMKKLFITMIQNLCTIDYQLKTIQNQLQRSPATVSEFFLNSSLEWNITNKPK